MSDDLAGPWRRASGPDLEWCVSTLRTAIASRSHRPPPERPRAMQLALYLPKSDAERPRRSDLLAAAARATAELCLDTRVTQGGPWHDAYTAWIDTQMRKVARRARGSHWDATAALAHVEATEPAATPEAPALATDPVSTEPAELTEPTAPSPPRAPAARARAFVPGPMDSVDPVIARLQVGGTDLPPDQPGPVPPGSLILLVDDDLHMSAGKAAAQVGHCIMLLLAALPVERVGEWLDAGLPLAVRGCSGPAWQALAEAVDAGESGCAGVRDAGYTEVAPDSLTVIGVDPESAPRGRRLVAQALERPAGHGPVGRLPERGE